MLAPLGSCITFLGKTKPILFGKQMYFQENIAKASVFSLGKASLEQLLDKHISNLSKGTDNSETLHLTLKEEPALGAL